jgi:hypothetical protein
VYYKLILSRIVHAKGAGAYGVFETTHDISNYTSLAFLNQVGKVTPLFARFSTVAGEKGSADNVRDARGFAFKLYTKEGNLDWLFFGAVSRLLFTSKNATMTDYSTCSRCFKSGILQNSHLSSTRKSETPQVT